MAEVVEKAAPFLPAAREEVAAALVRLTDLYAKCVTGGDVTQAAKQLRVHQREHVVWERDTVWRRMLGRQRFGSADGPAAVAPAEDTTAAAQSIGTLPTPVGKVYITRKRISLLVAFLVFIIMLNVPSVDNKEANRCLAILILATILWATEVTSLSLDYLRSDTPGAGYPPVRYVDGHPAPHRHHEGVPRRVRRSAYPAAWHQVSGSCTSSPSAN